MCRMTERQRLLYRGLRNKITIEELLASTSTASTAQATSNTLMNLVMQFRKVRERERASLLALVTSTLGL